MFVGDVWNVQPAPKDHPWRTMHNPLGGGNGMYVLLPPSFPSLPPSPPSPQSQLTLTLPFTSYTHRVPHVSGTSIDAQARYAAGTKAILENYFDNKPQDPGNVIVANGEYATKAYGQRK